MSVLGAVPAKAGTGPSRRRFIQGAAASAAAVTGLTALAPRTLSSQLVISESQRLAVRQQSHLLYHSPSVIAAGNTGASLSIAVFFDYNCPVCREFSDGLFELADEDRNIRLVFREYPIFGAESEYVAKAAIASRNQDKYVELHRALMHRSGSINRRNVMTIAEEVGVDTTQLEAEMSRQEVRVSLAETRELANILNVPGTPTYVVDDILVGGAPRDVLATLVEVVRSNRCNTCKG